MTVEEKIRDLQEEFDFLEEELTLLQKRTNHKSQDLRERIVAKVREIDERIYFVGSIRC
jgi:hypothetical protein